MFHGCLKKSDASMEADVAKGRRDWAFSERDKVYKLLTRMNFEVNIESTAIRWFEKL